MAYQVRCWICAIRSCPDYGSANRPPTTADTEVGEPGPAPRATARCALLSGQVGCSPSAASTRTSAASIWTATPRALGGATLKTTATNAAAAVVAVAAVAAVAAAAVAVAAAEPAAVVGSAVADCPRTATDNPP